MTRIRVLQKAIQLLENGFLPYPGPLAKDATGAVVSVFHPSATQFAPTPAIDRAIYDLTGDLPEHRQYLWNDVLLRIKKKTNNSWFTLYYKVLENASKEEVLSFFNETLEEWKNL